MEFRTVDRVQWFWVLQACLWILNVELHITHSTLRSCCISNALDVIFTYPVQISTILSVSYSGWFCCVFLSPSKVILRLVSKQGRAKAFLVIAVEIYRGHLSERKLCYWTDSTERHFSLEFHNGAPLCGFFCDVLITSDHIVSNIRWITRWKVLESSGRHVVIICVDKHMKLNKK
jgi:hypothetical protein